MGLKESGLRGSLRNVSVGIDAIPDSGNLHAHYDAQQIDETDGETITVWNDESGNGYNATDGTQATYRESSLNGEPAVDFDGVDDLLTVPDSTGEFTFLHDGSPASVYIVAEVQTPDSFDIIIDTGAGSTSQVGYGIFGDDGDGNIDWRVNNASDNIILTKGSRQTGDNLIETHADQSSNPEAELFINESQVDTDSYDNPSSEDSDFNFSIGGEEGGDRTLDCLLSEIMIYQTHHDSTTRGEVRSYLNNRWGR